MIYLPLSGIHVFGKKNIVTQFDKRGQYDIMVCSICGIEGLCRDLQTVEIKRASRKASYCKLSDKEIKNLNVSSEYNQGVKLKLKCPDCGKKLSKTDTWYKEGNTLGIYDKITTISVVCLCGYKAFIDYEKANKGIIEKFK